VSEADLVLRAQAGDAAAYDTLVREHQQAAFRLAYLLLGDATDAEDVAQEAFIRAFKALRRFDVTRPFRPWLLSITANLARNRRRSLGRYWAAVRRLAEDSGRSNVVTAPEPVGDGWQARALWDAVRQLPVADQEIIYLRFYLGLPESEAAATLNIPAGTAKSRQHRALARLRGIAQREHPELREEYEGGR
jgi:RNA polymerase sigma-70 factor (ECF subfamily)